MATVVADDEPKLRIVYESPKPLPADEIAESVIALTHLFESYAKQHGYKRATLAFSRVETRCLILDLVAVIDSVVTLYDHRDLLAGFVTHVGDLIEILSGIRPGTVKQPERKSIQSVFAPVAKKQAVQINVNVVGDGNTVIITPDTIEAIRGAGIHVGPEKSKTVASRRTQHSTGIRKPFHPGTFGTAVWARSQWYVGLEGDGGVLRPADLAGGVALQDGQSYVFEGSIEGPRYRITNASPIGSV